MSGRRSTSGATILEALKLPEEVELKLTGTLRELEQKAIERKKAFALSYPEKADNGD